MPKKPNFDFERRQREKAKAEKAAEKAQAKRQKAELEAGAQLPPKDEQSKDET